MNSINIPGTNVSTNLTGKTGAEVTNMRAPQMAQIENNYNESANQNTNKKIIKSESLLTGLSPSSLLTGIGSNLDIKA